MSAAPSVLAAGGLVWRLGDAGVELVVIHRPKYDDWSFPKGKLDDGEHLVAAAVREVAEETGLPVRLGPHVAVQTYPVSGNGTTKEVHYWAARPTRDGDVAGYLPNAEIDEVVWMPAAKARSRLSYPRDVDVLGAFLESPYRTTPLLILRHARARSRSTWTRADNARPLTDGGQAQARALVPLLQAYGVRRVLSSDAERCMATVRPFTAETLFELEVDHRLSEARADKPGVREVVAGLLQQDIPTVVCTHRPVLPLVLEAAGITQVKLAPAGFVVAHHRRGRVRATEQHQA